jgi:holo-[acyl-carrier protein] synthase
MIIAIGIDLVEISRIEGVISRRGLRFCSRVFTDDESRYCESAGSKFASYAARFAAKEAVMKALGTGWGGGVGFRDIEVVKAGDGPPSVRLHGKAQERLEAIGARRVHLSLTHSEQLAVAQVVLES